MKATVIPMVMIMGIFSGQAIAGFEECYQSCYFDCINGGMEQRNNPVLQNKFVSCAWKCLKQCTIHIGSTDLYYCRLGCSMDSCSNCYDGIIVIFKTIHMTLNSCS